MHRPRLKQMWFFLAISTSFCALLEISAFVTYFLVRERVTSFPDVDVQQMRRTDERMTEGPGQRITWGPAVIHPYLGFVYDRDANTPRMTKKHGFPISAYGFIDDKGPIHVKSPDAIIVGVFGGSAAYWFSAREGMEALRRKLQEIPAYAERDLVVVRVALGGYKQPQQLMALNYLLALGAQFDVVINIDGFNEVVIAPTENLPKQVFPFYPKTWFEFTGQLQDPGLQSLMAHMGDLERRRENWAQWLTKTPLRYSMAVKLLWAWHDRRLARAVSRDAIAMLEYPVGQTGYKTTGPTHRYKHESDLYRDLAAVWKASSVLMHQLCEANGIQYFHFLQPNQYVPGSKPMGQKELRLAFLGEHPYKVPAEKGYPHLRRAGRELVAAGVGFHDFTMIFADRGEPLYADTCCHWNARGNSLLGEAIGEAIIQDLM